MDLIKREDAIKAIEKLPNAYNGWSDAYDKAYIIGTLEDPTIVPSADRPKPTHGYMWICPECGLDVHSDFDRCVRCGYERADRPQGWIPCSERLPNEQGQYLVTFPLCNGEPWVYVLSFNKGKFYETDDEWGDVEYDDVTAWMPLPEPWKGADDE